MNIIIDYHNNTSNKVYIDFKESNSYSTIVNLLVYNEFRNNHLSRKNNPPHHVD